MEYSLNQGETINLGTFSARRPLGAIIEKLIRHNYAELSELSIALNEKETQRVKKLLRPLVRKDDDFCAYNHLKSLIPKINGFNYEVSCSYHTRIGAEFTNFADLPLVIIIKK
jgi:hypothetical protein